MLAPSADRYAGRREAGHAVAALLGHYAGRGDVVVLGLPRGGVPVAAEVARAIGAPLDVFVVRRLGVPGYRELAMGAIATGGVRVLNADIVSQLRISPAAIEAVAAREERELDRRERAYRGDRARLALHGRIVILVDDGLATGSTMRAAIQAVRRHHPARIVAVAAVGAPDTCRDLQREADEVICPRTREPLTAVGAWYRAFPDTSDDEVRAVLNSPDLAQPAVGMAP